MTLAELKTKANAKLATLWSVIQAKEDAYYATHGRYFGLRWSPSVSVVDGVDTPLVLSFPSRGIVTNDVSFSATDVPFQIRIFRLTQDDQGETYQAWICVELPNGDIYERNRFQNGTDSNWYKVTQI